MLYHHQVHVKFKKSFNIKSKLSLSSENFSTFDTQLYTVSLGSNILDLFPQIKTSLSESKFTIVHKKTVATRLTLFWREGLRPHILCLCNQAHCCTILPYATRAHESLPLGLGWGSWTTAKENAGSRCILKKAVALPCRIQYLCYSTASSKLWYS